MELDDLRSLWRQEQARGQPAPGGPSRARPGLWRIHSLVAFELLVALATAAWSAGFLAAHGGAPRFALAGGVLLAAGLAGLLSGLRQGALLWRVDVAGPVVEQQRRLERLRVLRLRAARVALLVGLPCWVALPIAAARGLLGIDLVAAAGWPWIAANVGFGLLLVPAAAWLASGRSPARLRDHLTGRSLAEALEALERLG